MKSIIPIELSKKSLEQAKKLVQKYENSYKKGVNNSIRVATEKAYQRVIDNCIASGTYNNLSNYTSAIQWEFDEKTNVGKVWVKSEGIGSPGLVIILHEFGTGIRGTANDYAEAHGYTINESGKGAEGWWYPTTESDPNPYKWVDGDGQLRALTHGVPSYLMFYHAFEDTKEEFKDIVNIELNGEIGKLY